MENTSIRGDEELEIKKGTIYDLQAFIRNSRDQITEVESRQLDAEDQLVHGREESKMLLIVFFDDDDYDD